MTEEVNDTLHNEAKPQKVIAKGDKAVNRVLYQSIFIESWVEGESVAEKGAQVTSGRIVKQRPFHVGLPVD